MSTRIAINGSTAVSVYDDRFFPLLSALGSPRVERASEVEYDHQTGEWIATHKATGQEIGRSQNRSEAIAQEVAWLERRL